MTEAPETVADAKPAVAPPEVRGAETEPDAIDTLVLEQDVKRTRIGGLRALLASLSITTVVLALIGDDSWSTHLLTLAFLLNTLFIGAMLVVAIKRGYSDLVSASVGVSATLLNLISCAVLGVDSTAVVGLPALVFYFGFGDSKLRRRAVLVLALAGYAFLIALTLAGVLPTPGIVFAEDPTRRYSRFFVGGLGLAVLQVVGITYYLARKMRRSTLDAMAALERARRGIRQRDALLQEANANLDRVMDGARVGRHTGRSVGHFQVGNVLGRGAIGEVYAARDLRDGRPVALKVLHPHLEAQSGHVQRFEREVQIVGGLRSGHIPAFVESGVDGDGAPYLAMERLDGIDLATELRHRKRLTHEEIDELVDHAARALQAAHDAGVVHRDIKPQNLFRVDSPKPHWKVLDFGVSKLMTGEGTLTHGAAVGTPAYMAPEQVAGSDVDARADVFALGAVVYRALTGRPAFSGPSEVVTMLRVTKSQPVCPGELAQVHPDVDAVLALALAKDRDERLPGVAAFASAWKAARDGRLEPKLRAAATALLSLQPWGQEIDEKTRVMA